MKKIIKILDKIWDKLFEGLLKLPQPVQVVICFIPILCLMVVAVTFMYFDSLYSKIYFRFHPIQENEDG